MSTPKGSTKVRIPPATVFAFAGSRSGLNYIDPYTAPTSDCGTPDNPCAVANNGTGGGITPIFTDQYISEMDCSKIPTAIEQMESMMMVSRFTPEAAKVHNHTLDYLRYRWQQCNLVSPPNPTGGGGGGDISGPTGDGYVHPQQPLDPKDPIGSVSGGSGGSTGGGGLIKNLLSGGGSGSSGSSSPDKKKFNWFWIVVGGCILTGYILE